MESVCRIPSTRRQASRRFPRVPPILGLADDFSQILRSGFLTFNPDHTSVDAWITIRYHSSSPLSPLPFPVVLLIFAAPVRTLLFTPTPIPITSATRSSSIALLFQIPNPQPQPLP